MMQDRERSQATDSTINGKRYVRSLAGRNRLGVILAPGRRGFEAAAAITMTRPWIGQKTAEDARQRLAAT